MPAHTQLDQLLTTWAEIAVTGLSHLSLQQFPERLLKKQQHQNYCGLGYRKDFYLTTPTTEQTRILPVNTENSLVEWGVWQVSPT